ncbi:MAG: CHRD domain-containing protein [Ardenticatenales bacterium]|nr:CHRD domain-containing protein [Ardenticatenales bacterium]
MRPKSILVLVLLLIVVSSLVGCAQQAASNAEPTPAPATAAAHNMAGHTPAASSGQAQNIAAEPPEPVTLDISQGQEIGAVYEAYLSPHQEPGEEKDTPSSIPEQFRSTTPSLLRNERQSRGHGMLRFTNDLSRAYVDVQVEGLNTDEIVMFHIHCGRPDQLGPIIVDFALTADLASDFADGTFSVEITNEIIEQTAASGEGVVGALTMGCPIPAGLQTGINFLNDKAKTVAGLEYIAQEGDLYFNLHTSGQVYFGDMRGQLHEVEE